MTGKSGNFVYLLEDDIIQLRRGFRLTADGYLSKGSLLYVLETVQDLSSKNYEEALVVKAAYSCSMLLLLLILLSTEVKGLHLEQPTYFCD
jgi:hypothetical protein